MRESELAIFFQNYGADRCCICGETENLTGEHKIKASALRQEFGVQERYIITSAKESGKPRYAQSSRSKHFQFNVRVCQACNTHRTQPADREFDNFHRAACSILSRGNAPERIFEETRYRKGSEPYLNVFRYFAKLLCCHMAEVEAPRPTRLSRFAMQGSKHNPVWLAVHQDWEYLERSAVEGEHMHAAHGGLIVLAYRSTGNAAAFHSTVSLGPIQYVFFMPLAGLERIELRLMYPKFLKWCRKNVAAAVNSPLSLEELKRQGLSK